MKYEIFKERPIDSEWEKMKGWIGWPEGADLSMPPMFGWICDQLRINYNIYVSVYPHNYVSSAGLQDRPNISFRFQGVVSYMPTIGKADKVFNASSIYYQDTMRVLLQKATEWLQDMPKK